MKTSKGSSLTNEQIIDGNTPQPHLAAITVYLLYIWYTIKQLNKGLINRPKSWLHQKQLYTVPIYSKVYRFYIIYPTPPAQRQKFHHVALHWVVTLMKTRTAPADSWNSPQKKRVQCEFCHKMGIIVAGSWANHKGGKMQTLPTEK